MPRTPDARHGELFEEEGIRLGTTETSSQPGELRYTGIRFSLKDSIGEFDPRTSGGISESQHKTLDHLVHSIAESCYYEITWEGIYATVETWWETDSKLKKVRSITYTYDGPRCTQELIEQYDGSGIKVATLQIDYTYDGPRVISADYTYSEP